MKNPRKVFQEHSYLTAHFYGFGQSLDRANGMVQILDWREHSYLTVLLWNSLKIIQPFTSNSNITGLKVLVFFLSAFLRNFFLCQDCWHGDVCPHLAQPCYVALGWALDSGAYFSSKSMKNFQKRSRSRFTCALYAVLYVFLSVKSRQH